MNWTGGHLQQSKRSGASLSVKQKNFFAKARLKLLNPPHAKSPISFPFVRYDEQPPQATWKTKSQTDGEVRTHRRSQSRVDTCRDAARLAEPPSLLPSIFRLQGQYAVQCSTAERSSGRQSSSPLIERTDKETLEGPSDQTIVRKRKRSISSTDNLDDKRRALLKRTDWMGLGATRPLKIKFPSDHQSVGRRRRLNDADMERRQGSFLRRGKPTVGEVKWLPREQSSDLEAFDSDEVSVRIGASIHGSQRTLPVREHLESSQLQTLSDERLLSSISYPDTSDGMLLEDELNGRDTGASLSHGGHFIGSQKSHALPGFDQLLMQDKQSNQTRAISRDKSQMEPRGLISPAQVTYATNGECSDRDGRSDYSVAISRPCPGVRREATEKAARSLDTPNEFRSAPSSNLARGADDGPPGGDNCTDERVRGHVSECMAQSLVDVNGKQWRVFMNVVDSSNISLRSKSSPGSKILNHFPPTLSNPSTAYLERDTDAEDKDNEPWMGFLRISEQSDTGSLRNGPLGVQREITLPPSVQFTRNHIDDDPYAGPLHLVASDVSGFEDVRKKPSQSLSEANEGPRESEANPRTTNGIETVQNENEGWFNFVFGHFNEDNNADNASAQSSKNFHDVGVTPSSQRSMQVQASENENPSSTTKVPVSSSDNTDSLALPDYLSTVACASSPPKVIFKKPAPFASRTRHSGTIHIGRNLSSSPAEVHGGDKWRKPIATNRWVSEAIWVPGINDSADEIED